MSNGKLLSIVIPVFNKFNFTKSCLDDLSKLPDNHEIIIVDNGSTDETESQLKNNTRIVYHRNSTNLGFGKSSNIGYGLSTAPNVLFLNNDIRVKSNYEDWTKPLIEKCEEGLVGPTMGQLDNDFNFIKEANCQLDGLSYMSGWCLASSKTIWERVRNIAKLILPEPIVSAPEIFSEDFFCYFEDADLSFRSRQLGIKMQVVDVPVVHFKKQTSAQLNTYQLYTQARKVFINKWKIMK